MSKFWKSVRSWLPGLLISLTAIFLILQFVDLRKFTDAMLSANYWLLGLAFACSFIWLALRGVVWRTILRRRVPYRDVFLTLNEGYLLNNFLPFRLGEIGRAFLLGRKSGLGFMEILPTIIIERVLDLAFAAAILLSAVPFVVGAEGAGRIAILIGGLVLFGLLVLFLLARNRERALAIFGQLFSRWPRLQRTGAGFLDSLFSGLAILTDGWLFLRVLLWMSVNWAFAIFQYYVLLLAFFPQAEPLWSLFGLGAVAFGNAIPSLPGAVGTYEGAFGGAIALLSGDQSTSLAAALAAHLIGYLSTGILGLYALSTEGETLMGIYRQLRRRQEKPEGGPG
jgi:hypothetical protein